MAWPGLSDAGVVPQAPAGEVNKNKLSQRKIEHDFNQAIRETEKAHTTESERIDPHDQAQLRGGHSAVRVCN